MSNYLITTQPSNASYHSVTIFSSVSINISTLKASHTIFMTDQALNAKTKTQFSFKIHSDKIDINWYY